MILIGSRAIKYWFDDFNRKLNDVDYIKSESSQEYFHPSWTDLRIEYYDIPIISNKFKDWIILEPDILYTLKMSHIFWDIHWNKHISDIQFLKSKGCILDKELFRELYDFWCIKHGFPQRPNFKLNNSEFFNDVVVRRYDHDLLHEMISSPPIYKKLKHDQTKADVDEMLFRLLLPEEQYEVVREEAMVLALERYIFNENANVRNRIVAYSRALKMLITRLLPEWLALYAIENYQKILNSRNDEKWKNYLRVN